MKSNKSIDSDNVSKSIDETSDYFIQSTNSFFSGGIDLVKWTAAIASATIIWI